MRNINKTKKQKEIDRLFRKEARKLLKKIDKISKVPTIAERERFKDTIFDRVITKRSDGGWNLPPIEFRGEYAYDNEFKLTRKVSKRDINKIIRTRKIINDWSKGKISNWKFVKETGLLSERIKERLKENKTSEINKLNKKALQSAFSLLNTDNEDTSFYYANYHIIDIFNQAKREGADYIVEKLGETLKREYEKQNVGKIYRISNRELVSKIRSIFGKKKK